MNHGSFRALYAVLAFAGCTPAGPPVVLNPDIHKGPAIVPVEANCSFTQAYPEDPNCCVMRPYTTAGDVDATYSVAAGAFGFTPSQGWIDEAAEAYPALYRGHEHAARAGTSYELKGLVVPRSDTKLYRGLWLGLTLTKVTNDSTRVEAVYCEMAGRAMENQLAWHRAVQRSIVGALPAQVTR